MSVAQAIGQRQTTIDAVRGLHYLVLRNLISCSAWLR